MTQTCLSTPHTTDAHGFTEQIFGLCFLLGFAFMPRLKDLASQRLYRLDRVEVNWLDYSGPTTLEPVYKGCNRLSIKVDEAI